MKWRGNVIDHVTAQALLAVADPIYAPATTEVDVYPFGYKGDDEIVIFIILMSGKISLQAGEEFRGGSDFFLGRPGGGALGDEAYAEFFLIIVRRRFHQPADFFVPAGVARAKGRVGQRFDADDSLRLVVD